MRWETSLQFTWSATCQLGKSKAGQVQVTRRKVGDTPVDEVEEPGDNARV